MLKTLFETLEAQRRDDHRYYHRSTINQALHLVSAITFLCCYVLVFVDPAAAVLIGWLVAMVTRQTGHFVFEPKTYDPVNNASHAYKEEIKVGYNLRRKVFLHVVWVLAPIALLVDPTLFGVFAPHADAAEFARHVAYLWLAIGIGALLFRTAQLFVKQGVVAGLAWFIKILTDPFHDVMLYYKAPLYLLRGELLDPGKSGVRPT